ncbi:MAG: hypothetical protein MJ082_04725 [Clostridia bacterium]|nr:hypothetical protein [Clostridia bacterium]
MPLDERAFAEARRRVLGETTTSGGIGTLGEKALHRIIKLTAEPDESRHEIKVAGCVADVLNEDGITEIQTANFSHLLPKLPKFLPLCPVHIAYPSPNERWIDPETGEMTERRRSPKKGSIADAFRELYTVRNCLLDERLTLSLVFLNVEDYRLRNGWDKTGKRGSHKVERLPLSIERQITLKTADDYRAVFLPADLPRPFTVGQYRKYWHTTYRAAYTGIRILTDLHLLERIGKQGREYLFSDASENSESL